MNSKIKAAFDEVHAEDALKQRTKRYLAAQTRSARRPGGFYSGRLVAACLVLALFGFGGWRFYVTPVSAISVDVNPSVELNVNRFDRVVSVDGYNEDGTALATAVELTNLEYSDAIEVLLSSDAMSSYLESDAQVSITVVGRSDEESEKMRARIAACDYAAAPNVACQSGNRKEVAAAHEAGLSFGKYRAFLNLQALAPEVSVEDVRGLTIRQIWDWIAELSGETGAGCGEGAGHGGEGYRGGQ